MILGRAIERPLTIHMKAQYFAGVSSFTVRGMFADSEIVSRSVHGATVSSSWFWTSD